MPSSLVAEGLPMAGQSVVFWAVRLSRSHLGGRPTYAKDSSVITSLKKWCPPLPWGAVLRAFGEMAGRGRREVGLSDRKSPHL